ncbi:hypothetical protein BH23CHL6_BH23CHL6_08650 [soil metagenome]
MEAALDSLARYARPILLVVAGLLAVGVMLAVLGMPLLGWGIFGIGWLGLLIALPAVVGVYRVSMDWFAWVALAVLYAGIVLMIPVVVVMWGHYAENPALQEVLMAGDEVAPLGLVAGIVAWVGLVLFGWAAYRVRLIPRGGAVLFMIAGVLALLAEMAVLAPVMWVLGILLAACALVWIAPETEVRRSAAV